MDGYKGIGSVDASYLENVRLMVKLQIMTGTGEDTFSPKGVTTRAQAAVVFIRTLHQLGMID
ncbi:S-layer homology domain-containing protein [Paenibacillus sepulcri]|uniref:S-layer homology domain-containing protein n=1 Tax=Paenibacillus sepulcri TaxID=359917 RepID=A0ABS7C3H9_9BACL|nr:S-layer homology domain-containing protein [Paenibacillus sepulcri]